MNRRWAAMFVLLFCAWLMRAGGQSNGKEGRIASDFRREREQLQNCKKFDVRSIGECAQVLFTAQPVHIALGSLAPQNGFAFGLAFVEHKNCPDASERTSHPFCPSEWRLTWNADAVTTPNGSWRAGAYMKAFRLSGGGIQVHEGNAKAKRTAPLFRSAPLFNLYAQAISLNKIYFYGLGPDTTPIEKTVFGETQTIAGASVIVPTGVANTSLYGEINGRVPSIRGNHGDSVPSIEVRFNNVTAPGLTSQPGFVQFGEGLRIEPELLHQHLHLHYGLGFQQFVAVSDSRYSFRRWTADLGHDFPIDRKVQPTAANDRIGPDSCTPDANSPCPSPTVIPRTFDHEGMVSLRFLLTGSLANAHRSVPFYFDPTVGGSDLNGQPILPSYPDYRFRGPDVALIRGTIEHAVPRLPLGVFFSVDAAKATLLRDDIDFSNLRRSYTAGFTVHAGGLPVAYFLFAWGGNEGSHTTVSVSNVLLGGSARPSLF
jgi:hypothetical protein